MGKEVSRSPDEVVALFSAAMRSFMRDVIDSTVYTEEIQLAVVDGLMQYAVASCVGLEPTEEMFVERARLAYRAIRPMIADCEEKHVQAR